MNFLSTNRHLLSWGVAAAWITVGTVLVLHKAEPLYTVASIFNGVCALVGGFAERHYTTRYVRAGANFYQQGWVDCTRALLKYLPEDHPRRPFLESRAAAWEEEIARRGHEKA